MYASKERGDTGPGQAEIFENAAAPSIIKRMSDAWETLDRAANIIEVAGAVYFLGWAAFRLRRGRTIRVEVKDKIGAADGITISAHSGGTGGSFANLVTLTGVNTDELVGTLKAVPGAVSVALKGVESDELVGTLAPPSALEELLMWYLRVR